MEGGGTFVGRGDEREREWEGGGMERRVRREREQVSEEGGKGGKERTLLMTRRSDCERVGEVRETRRGRNGPARFQVLPCEESCHRPRRRSASFKGSAPPQTKPNEHVRTT